MAQILFSLTVMQQHQFTG